MEQILIIEDEAPIRRMLHKHLTRIGYDAIQAKNGQEGLKLFEQHQPPLILLDLKMPVMDGIAFLEQLPSQSFEEHIFVVVTGHGGDSEIERCYELGVHSFLKKPVNLIELQALLKRSFDSLQARSQIQQMNQRMSSLLKNIPDIVWECNSDLHFTYISDNVEQILGYTPDSMINNPISDYLLEKDVAEFYFKFEKGIDELTEETRGLQFSFRTSQGSSRLMQVSANQVIDENGQKLGMVGISRDIHGLSEVRKGLDIVTKAMTIRLNSQLKLVSVDESLTPYFTDSVLQQEEGSDFTPLLQDESVIPLFEFAFDQQEDLPFPVEVKLTDASGIIHHFQVQFTYLAKEACLEGHLSPIQTEDQLTVMNQHIERQEEALKSSVLIDPEMQESILLDSQNLASEILTLIKALEPYVFSETEAFKLDRFKVFISNKNMQEYQENLRLLGNKIHGYKGTSGFLIPYSKQLCHRMEDITRPLANHELVLTYDLYEFIKKFIFKAQDLLEAYKKSPETPLQEDSWLESIDRMFEKGQHYLGDQQKAYEALIVERSKDDGQVRHRQEEYLAVPSSGYLELAEQVKSLFYTLTEALSSERLIQASNLYNAFLDKHQQIVKVPLDLSRYERLIPSLAEEYDKKVNFVVRNLDVKADREFWNALHEILNHSLKNAVVHGIETVEERTTHDKQEDGEITVEVKEDALNIYICISDDGRGINVEKIKEKALENHIASLEQIQNMSTSEVLNLVFIQGVSTADHLDDNAGRGVGLNAVQEAMVRFHGTCVIASELGKGTSWNFTFPKSNVSLPGFVIAIGDFLMAVPEDSVDTFHSYESEHITHVKQKPVYQYEQGLIPLLDPQEVFDDQVHLDQTMPKRILVLKPRQQPKVGMVINKILHHATLPILPMPEVYRDLKVYTGSTLFLNTPVPVLDTNHMLN